MLETNSGTTTDSITSCGSENGGGVIGCGVWECFLLTLTLSMLNFIYSTRANQNTVIMNMCVRLLEHGCNRKGTSTHKSQHNDLSQVVEVLNELATCKILLLQPDLHIVTIHHNKRKKGKWDLQIAPSLIGLLIDWIQWQSTGQLNVNMRPPPHHAANYTLGPQNLQLERRGMYLNVLLVMFTYALIVLRCFIP